MQAKRTCLFILKCVLLAVSVRAQSYAPDTDFHDCAQRFFVPEAARVLAWRENQSSNQIAEITYQLTTSNQNTHWEIQWRDASGKTNKSAQIDYPSTALKQGADFYRQAFNQLW